jgi:protein-L-isoaspartate(D-aspartate) O-methyltransferase
MDELALKTFFQQLNRSDFINNEYKQHASDDRPLPLGFGQTISQPTLVLEMTRLLSPEKDSRVLEIGTGSGYQTSFLAEFSKAVYTIERFREFTEEAKSRLDHLCYDNILFKTGDGSDGWPEYAPFDRIMVTAAAGKMPSQLLSQLNTGGRMVVPVGNPSFQILKLITKDREGNLQEQDIEMVRFVEMKGRYGWDSP